MKKKRLYGIGGGLLVIFILFTVLVKTVHVEPIGPEGSSVGFAKLNGAVAQAIGVHMAWYKLTEVLGYLAILVALIFVIVALVQCVKCGGPRKVDRDLKALILLYIVVIIFYAIFEVAIVNYRPVLMDGVLEASYPSSHTMLVICVMASSLRMFRTRFRNRTVRLGAEGLAVLILVLTVVGRLVSGVHWFTDIIGGVLLGAALTTLYYGLVTKKPRPRHPAA